MKDYQLHTEQFLPISLDKAWSFFSSPQNLSKITPPELKFKIESNLQQADIHNGMNIRYTVSPLLGIPLTWVTEITQVNQPSSFTDRQIAGPYKKWEHTHTFVPVENGVMMYDLVKYQLPFSFLGKFAHWLFVRKKIETIFYYRKEVLTSIF